MALAGSYLAIYASQKYKINSELVEQRVVLFLFLFWQARKYPCSLLSGGIFSYT